MSRHQSERSQRETGNIAGEGIAETTMGIGKSYSHQDAIAERAKTGMVSPREAEMARGYHAGRESELAGQTVGGFASRAMGPQIGSAVKAGVGMVAGAQLSSPEASYGASVGRNQTSNSGLQSAAQAGAGMALGPAGSLAVGAINTGINANKTKDYGRMSESMGFNSNAAAPAGSGNASSQVAMPAIQRARQAFAPARSFESPTLDMGAYSSGLMSLSQNL